MDTPRWDVLGLGIVAVDDLLVVERYPPADSKAPILLKSRQGGGLTGTALVAAARLGARCAYAGVLGEDELSAWTLAELVREGVDCGPLLRRPDARPFHSTVVIGQQDRTRTIFFSGHGAVPRPPDKVDESLIGQTRVLFLDHHGVETALHAARLAQKLGIPTVADVERETHPRLGELIADTDHLIVGAGFAAQLTGAEEPARAVGPLAAHTARACTAVTAGDRGCWYVTREHPGAVRHVPAFPVAAVDTTGCGDVFHGAYAAGVAWGWPVAQCLRFATAAAALKATKVGGRAGIPDRATVERFLAETAHQT